MSSFEVAYLEKKAVLCFRVTPRIPVHASRTPKTTEANSISKGNPELGPRRYGHLIRSKDVWGHKPNKLLCSDKIIYSKSELKMMFFLMYVTWQVIPL